MALSMFIYQVVGVPDIRLANLIVYIPICANIMQRRVDSMLRTTRELRNFYHGITKGKLKSLKRLLVLQRRHKARNSRFQMFA